jgi:hypothetical protein
MPLSTWLVIHQGESSAATSFSAPASPNRDTTVTPPPYPPETLQKPRKSAPTTRRLSLSGHPVAAPEKLMPRTFLPPTPSLHCSPSSAPGNRFNDSPICHSSIVIASPVPAASLHYTTRLAFNSESGGPQPSKFRRDPDGPHTNPSAPCSMRGAGDTCISGARTARKSIDAWPPPRTKEDTTLWHFLHSRRRQ